MEILYSTFDVVVGFATYCLGVIATTDPLLLGICALVALCVALGFVVAVGPASGAYRLFIFIVIGAFSFAGAVTLVELGPILFDPVDLARSQVTPEID